MLLNENTDAGDEVTGPKQKGGGLQPAARFHSSQWIPGKSLCGYGDVLRIVIACIYKGIRNGTSDNECTPPKHPAGGIKVARLFCKSYDVERSFQLFIAISFFNASQG